MAKKQETPYLFIRWSHTQSGGHLRLSEGLSILLSESALITDRKWLCRYPLGTCSLRVITGHDAERFPTLPGILVHRSQIPNWNSLVATRVIVPIAESRFPEDRNRLYRFQAIAPPDGFYNSVYVVRYEL